MMEKTSYFRKIWAWPVALAVLTMGGLLTALLGESERLHVLAWTSLAIPLLLLSRFLLPALRKP